jgi:organic hydroperoxide reductase OsmC/OhrA
MAGSTQFDFTDLQVEACGTVRKVESGYRFSEIVIRPNVQITSSKEWERALDLLKKAEGLCLVSRAIGTPLRFEPQIEITEVVPPV